MKLAAIETVTPSYRASPEEVIEAATEWLGEGTTEHALFLRYLRSSRTLNRNFVRPPLEIVRLKGSHERARIFEREAPRLAYEAAEKLLKTTGVQPHDIDALVFTSCSCPIIPAPDTYIIDHLGLRRDIVRIPSYQFGCAGGLIGLGLGNRLGQGARNVLLVSSELCSLLFHHDNRSAAQLVGASIFADGAAAALLRSDAHGPGLTIIDHQSFLIPESRHLMGYEIRDNGSHLLLDKELPMHLADWVPRLVDAFLTERKLSRKDVPWWLFHPGGTKILDYLGKSLELNPSQARWAGEVLENTGNLSSATILFVIDKFMRDKEAQPNDYVMIVGVGPGLTIEIILAQNTPAI
jgi:alkylresorcinol/alkylpyrone synthase